MNILLSGNDHVYPGMELVIYSTLTHNKNINFYVLSMDITQHASDGVRSYIGLQDYQKEKLEKIVHYLDSRSKITFIDAAPFYQKYLEGGPNEFSNFTPYAPLRLCADVMLPYVDDLLYLDCDTAVCKNLESMYNDCLTHQDGYVFATYAEDAYGGDGEMVSGIMFFNLAKCRTNGFLERARQNFLQNFYVFPDQMALRDAGTIYRLPSSYGDFKDMWLTKSVPHIVHFTCDLTKIYDSNYSVPYFYRKYPQFEYVQKGLRLLDTIN